MVIYILLINFGAVIFTYFVDLISVYYHLEAANGPASAYFTSYVLLLAFSF
jgi:hypothetical protein